MGLEVVSKTTSQFFLLQPPFQGVGGVVGAQFRCVFTIKHVLHGVTENVCPMAVLQLLGQRYVYLRRNLCQQRWWQWVPHRLMFTWQWGIHCCLRFFFLLALVLGKPFFNPSPKLVFLGESVAEVADLLPIAVDLIILDVAKVAHDIKLFGEGLAEIPMDVIHSGGPRMVQPCFKPVR